MAFAERLGNFIWNPWLLGLFLLSGLYFSVRTGFFQLFHVRLWLKTTLGSLLRPEEAAGGAGAYPAPGPVHRPGLHHWHWLHRPGWLPPSSTAGQGGVLDVGVRLSGHDDRMCRKDLAVRYRREKPRRRLAGRPHVLHGRGSGQPDAGRPVFPVLCGRLLGGGNVVQANSIAASLEAAFGWDRLAVGLVVAQLTGLVILGGIGRIGRVSETLVPPAWPFCLSAAE